VLYSLLHAISRTGCDNSSIDQVFDYLKRSFQFTDAKHDELLSTVRQRTVSNYFTLISCNHYYLNWGWFIFIATRCLAAVGRPPSAQSKGQGRQRYRFNLLFFQIDLFLVWIYNQAELNIVGMSDPYCSIWISSNRQKFQDTSMKPRTLDPVWNETLNLWVFICPCPIISKRFMNYFIFIN
jgi:hypothetical protein